MLAEYHAQLRFVHIACVTASGSLFALRGLLAQGGLAAANHIALRALSWAIDSCLLAAALLLVAVVHQYPFVDAWLTAKVLLLLAYMVLGSLALRRARTPGVRLLAYVAALAVFLCIVAVAHWKDPLAPLRLLRG